MSGINFKREISGTVDGAIDRVTMAPGRISVELAAPSRMMRILGDAKLAELAREADTRIPMALETV